MKLLLRLRGLLCAGLLSCLAACGPGVGGTGTGNAPDPSSADGLQFFGATAQNVCSAAFAMVLGCTAQAVLPAERHFATDCAVARFSADSVSFDAPCEGWFFSGRWGVGADGVGRYHGLVGSDPVLPPGDPATLDVQAQGADLVVWLWAADGQLLAGPLTLSAVVVGR